MEAKGCKVDQGGNKKEHQFSSALVKECGGCYGLTSLSHLAKMYR